MPNDLFMFLTFLLLVIIITLLANLYLCLKEWFCPPIIEVENDDNV